MQTFDLGENNYKGFKVTIEHDDMANNPREWDNLGTMICFHSRYNLGDEHNHGNPDDFRRQLAFGIDPMIENCIEYWENGNGWSQLAAKPNAPALADNKVNQFIDKALEKAVILPLYLYDHSGLTISTSGFSCPWDSGQVGYIYITDADIRKEYGVKRISKQLRERVTQYLVNEVETYDKFLTGQVYCYTIENPEGEEIDSCWGFFDDYDLKYISEQINSQLAYFRKEYIQGRLKQRAAAHLVAHQQRNGQYIANSFRF